jgi:hypothetical protein
LCPLLCNCRFWSLLKPLLHTSQMKRFVVISDFGDKEITSESGSATYMFNYNQ